MELKKNRLAVSVFFLVNGFLSANWASRMPEIQKHLSLSHTELGVLLLVAATGALFSMPFMGLLTEKFGSYLITRVAGTLYAVSTGFLVFFQDPLHAGIFFFFAGVTAGALDVSMNAQAVFVERQIKRPIMSSFHGVFSVGLAMGAGTGTIFASLNVLLIIHLGIVASVCFFLNMFAGFWLIYDLKDHQIKSKESTGMILPNASAIPLGIIAFCCMAGETAVIDWSAIFMHKELNTDKAYSGIAFFIFSFFMTLGRFMGDKISHSIGNKRILILDSLLAIIGFSLVIFSSVNWIAWIGFGLIGAGLSTIVPIVYSIAGNLQGVAPSQGIAMTTTIGYAGFFVAPPVVGYISDTLNLRAGLGFIFLLILIMFLFILSLTLKNKVEPS